MRYLIKRVALPMLATLGGAAQYVLVPAQSESKAIHLCRTVNVKCDHTEEELDLAVRGAFTLGMEDEVVLDHIGMWYNEPNEEGLVKHPFNEGETYAPVVSR